MNSHRLRRYFAPSARITNAYGAIQYGRNSFKIDLRQFQPKLEIEFNFMKDISLKIKTEKKIYEKIEIAFNFTEEIRNPFKIYSEQKKLPLNLGLKNTI